MYNTGQYDYQILQELQFIDTTLSGISTVISTIANNWFPLVCGCVIVVGVIGLLNWLVKL